MTDSISRADAIETVLKYFIPRSHTGERGEHEEDFVRTIFKALPSAESEQGEWIKHEIEDTCRWVECSECHKEYPNIEMNFCPNCGAKMKGGDAEMQTICNLAVIVTATVRIQ